MSIPVDFGNFMLTDGLGFLHLVCLIQRHVAVLSFLFHPSSNTWASGRLRGRLRETSLLAQKVSQTLRCCINFFYLEPYCLGGMETANTCSTNCTRSFLIGLVVLLGSPGICRWLVGMDFVGLASFNSVGFDDLRSAIRYANTSDRSCLMQTARGERPGHLGRLTFDAHKRLKRFQVSSPNTVWFADLRPSCVQAGLHWGRATEAAVESLQGVCSGNIQKSHDLADSQVVFLSL